MNDPDTYPCNVVHMTFDKQDKNKHLRKNGVLKNGTKKTVYLYLDEWNHTLIYPPVQK